MNKYRLASRAVKESGGGSDACTRGTDLSSDSDDAGDFISLQSSSSATSAPKLPFSASGPGSTERPTPGRIRVRRSGKMKNYIAYAARILREAKANSTNIVPQRVIITGEGSGLSMAVSVAEILKRMFADDLRLGHPGTDCENVSSSSSSPS